MTTASKEELMKMQREIEIQLDFINQREKLLAAEDRRKKNIAEGKYTPLKFGIIKEDVYWCSGDEKIESYGFGVASDFLRGPSFDGGTRVVLIRNIDGDLIWVPESKNSNYEGCDNDINIPEDEAGDMIEIINL